MGSTAQLQFYDWEPNVLDPDGPDVPFAGSKALYDATQFAQKQKPKAEKTDVPPGSDLTPAQADKQNDSSSDRRYYLFGPDQLPIGPDQKPLRRATTTRRPAARSRSPDYEPAGGPPNKYAKGTQCLQELEALGSGGPPAGSQVFEVPRGIVVVEGEPAPNQSARVHRFFVLEDDSELNGKEIKNPSRPSTRRRTQPLVNMEFTDKGRAGVRTRSPSGSPTAAATARRSRRRPGPHAAVDQTSSSASRSRSTTRSSRWRRSTTRRTRTASTAATARRSRTSATIQEAQDLAENLRIGALPIELKLISQTQVSATLGQQALHQGLHRRRGRPRAHDPLPPALLPRARAGGDASRCSIYAVFLFALIKLIPITLTLPGIAGMVLTLGGGGRREHRHVRANKGGGAGRALHPGRDLSRLREGARGRSSTRTS